MSDSRAIDKTIDVIADRATQQIQTARRRNVARRNIPGALWLLPAIPTLALTVQFFRWGLGLPAGAGWSLLWASAATLAVPLVWLAARTIGERIEVGRQLALRSMDESLGSSERVVTADQFLRRAEQTGFTKAAIEDAQSWVERARTAQLEHPAPPTVSRRLAWLSVPLAGVLLLAAAWLSTIAQPASTQAPGSEIARREQSPTDIRDSDDEHPPQPQPERNEPPESAQRRKTTKERNKSDKAPPANATPDDAEESQGQLSDGETSESQQSSNPSSARGEPSTQGQPAKSDVQSPKKPAKKRDIDEAKRSDERKDEPEDPSGVTAGQGSSKGSNNRAASSDWSSRSQSATPDDEDTEDEDDVEDEDEEQDSRGGVQPNLRDRRPPVNRDLQIGFGNRSDPDANGRGGPGAQKKSRGVASLVLGVPIPDRVNGQPNKGRIRITQQRIVPEAEDNDAVEAADRGTREGVTGPLPHQEFSPWLQQLVKRYFLERRSDTAAAEARLRDES